MFPKSGAPMEIDAHFRALLNISYSSPVRSPPSTIFQSPRYTSLPTKHQVPLGTIGAPMVRDAHIRRVSEYVFQGSKWRCSPPRPPSRSLVRERRPIPRTPFILLSKSLVEEPSSRFPKQGPYGDACLQSLFYISFRVPSKEALPSCSLHRTPTETVHLQSPFQPYLKVPGRRAHFRLPNWAPIKRGAHPQSLLFITFRASSKGAPSRFP